MAIMSDRVGLNLRFCGAAVDEGQFQFIQGMVQRFGQLSRTKLAATICEQMDWLRPSGKPKTVKCRQWLEASAERGMIDLPARQQGRPKGSRAHRSVQAIAQPAVECSLSALGPVTRTGVGTIAACTMVCDASDY